MKSTLKNLPKPTAEAQSLSDALTRLIREQILAEGPIPFASFMHQALYCDQLGYYQNDLKKLGREGDFVTAPEISALFSYCLANQYRELANCLQISAILEFGAGSGQMACDILTFLKEHNSLPEQYCILETSPSLQTRQKSLLSQKHPEYFDKIQWLVSLPEAFSGIILGNEVLDAMPVNVYRTKQGQIEKAFVDWQGNAFTWKWQLTTERFLPRELSDYPDDYYFEHNPFLQPWIASLSDCLSTGAILLIDYGHPQQELFHPRRNSGTLACHYRHQTHDNPLTLVGLQDLTAHVNFTAVVEAGEKHQLHLAGYTTQTQFLLGTGLLDIAANQQGIEPLLLAQQIKTLTLPSEMGERFQVMALCTQAMTGLCGFQFDLSYRL